MTGFIRWAKKGVRFEMFETLARQSPASLHLIDTSIVRALQHAAGGKKGERIAPSAVLVADRAPRSTPSSMRTACLSAPLLTPGQASDKPSFPALIDGLRMAPDVAADRGTFARTIIDLIEAAGATPISRARARSGYVASSVGRVYRQRNIVERFVDRLKRFRCMANRFDKLIRNLLAAVSLASVRLWTRHYESVSP